MQHKKEEKKKFMLKLYLPKTDFVAYENRGHLNKKPPTKVNNSNANLLTKFKVQN